MKALVVCVTSRERQGEEISRDDRERHIYGDRPKVLQPAILLDDTEREEIALLSLPAEEPLPAPV